MKITIFLILVELALRTGSGIWAESQPQGFGSAQIPLAVRKVSLEAASSPQTLRALYSSLNPKSVSQHLAFHELYPDSSEGKRALSHAWELLGKKDSENGRGHFATLIQAMTALVNRQPGDPIPHLEESELLAIEQLGKSLANRKLQGYAAQCEDEVLSLPSDQIDLGRAILCAQATKEGADKWEQRSYEALLDLMALQIRARLPDHPSPAATIHAMNQFLFGELGFRFPPHSLYAKEIDFYTFLPSVLDSRKGVCLGVSILYICLAQRLGMVLEMITPPGHIYVRYRSKTEEINIETTARGIHLNSEEYLGINTCQLHQRTLKEVIGFAYVNQASVYSQTGQYQKAVRAYEHAQQYLPDDFLLKELLGYHYLFHDETSKGMELLREVKGKTAPDAVVPETMAADLLNGQCDIKGIKAVFMPVDDSRESLLCKRSALEGVLEEYPSFREGLFNLAVVWIQLYRCQEAIEALQRYHALDANHPVVEYYLAMLYAEQFDYANAWACLVRAENIVHKHGYAPKALVQLRRALRLKCPESKNLSSYYCQDDLCAKFCCKASDRDVKTGSKN